MLCAHTVRKLKPGTFEQFAEAFRPDQGIPSGRWIRFNMLRGMDDRDQVVTFGFFDGTIEELNASQDEHGYRDRVEAVAPFVEEVLLNGLYDVVVDVSRAGSAA